MKRKEDGEARGERRNRNREDGGGLAASGAVADSRRDAGDSRLRCPVILGLRPAGFLLPRSPLSVFDTVRRRRRWRPRRRR